MTARPVHWMRIMKRVVTAAALLLTGSLVACSSAGSDAGGTGTEPTLEITSPVRGSFSEQESVVVTGKVSPSSARVTVNGLDIVPSTDGSFSAAVTLGSGLGFVETHAIVGSKDIRDVRAVLAGSVTATDGTVVAPVAARADAAALKAIGKAIGNTAEHIDFNAAVMAMNPVYNNTGCLGAVVDVTSVSMSNIDVALVPLTGSLDTKVTLDNVVVKAHVHFRAACIGGNTDVTLKSTHAHIDGNLAVALASGAIKTALPAAAVTLDGFTVDASGIPGVIEDLLKSSVKNAVANALTSVIKAKVPALADSTLAGLVSRPLSPMLFGHAVSLSLQPSSLTLSPTGLYVAVDTKIVVAGGEGGMFISTPSDASPSMMQGSGLSIALAANVANQMFSGLWATGAIDQTVPASAIGPGAAFLDDDVATLDIHLSLPPMVTATGNDLTLAIGDLIMTGRDTAGHEVQTIALSVKSTLAAAPGSDGKIVLTMGTPDIRAQVLLQSEAVDNKLSGSDFEGVISGAWGFITPMANEALGKLPMPTLAGVQIGTPSLAGQGGFVVAAMPLN